MPSFDLALAHTLGIEGGYSDDATDRGGKTRYGVTERVARAHGYIGPMADLPLEKAREIYRVDYWDKNKLDRVAEWSEKAAMELFDTGVNMGWQRAARFLQRALNAMNRNGDIYPDLRPDGLIGPTTIRALFFLVTPMDKSVVLKMLESQQGAAYMKIMANDPTQEKFARGWFDKRIGVPA